MTWRTMCDSDQTSALVPTDFVSTYCDLITSRDQWAALKTQFSRSTVLAIDRGIGDPLGIATLGDFEPGALTKAECRTWCEDRLNTGRSFITCYSDQDWLPGLRAAVQGLPVWAWVADPGQLTVPGHPAAITQVLFAPPRGPHIDLSIVKNDLWHPAQGSGDWTAGVLQELVTARQGVASAITTISAHQG